MFFRIWERERVRYSDWEREREREREKKRERERQRERKIEREKEREKKREIERVLRIYLKVCFNIFTSCDDEFAWRKFVLK